MAAHYPKTAVERDRWILARRPSRHTVDLRKPFAFFFERERAGSGDAVSVATIFLTNRECPWRCVFCDLWKNTLTETLTPGAIPQQIDFALEKLSAGRARTARQIKLYNSGSFFDPRAIPPEDYPHIAARVRVFERVIVECHPALIGESVLRFRDLLPATGGHKHAATTKLEVAMGLETAHPEVLKKLNKRMTLEQFRHAADFLRKNDIALRVFVLVKPPFLDEAVATHWAERSIDFAFDCGATAVSLIPTRPGNGALEALAGSGEFTPPKLSALEAALDYGIGLRRGRVFADTWDLAKFAECAECFERRQARLHQMNLHQVVQPPVSCDRCVERRGTPEIETRAPS